MTKEHVLKCQDDSAKAPAAEQVKQSIDHSVPNIVDAVVRRNRNAKVLMAKQLLEKGLARESVARLLNSSVSELF